MVPEAAVARVKRLRILESCILMVMGDVMWFGDYSIIQEEDLVVLRYNSSSSCCRWRLKLEADVECKTECLRRRE